MLLPFIDRWERTYADDPVFGGTLTATGFLAEKTGLSERTIQNITKRNRDTGAPAPHTRTTELRIADPLVAAVGRTEAFFDGTLQVKPNELASIEARGACCPSYR